MPRRARVEGRDTKGQLLEAATRELLEKDYDHASLRHICARAGVTTGALYFFFRNKEDLLRQVIAPLTGEVISFLEGYYVPVLEQVRTDEEDERVDRQTASRLLDIYYGHRDQLEIVMRNREQPVVEEFIDTFTTLVERQTASVMFGTQTVEPVNLAQKRGARWFARLQIDGVLAIMECDLPRDEAVVQVMTLVRFLRGGMCAVKRSACQGGE